MLFDSSGTVTQIGLRFAARGEKFSAAGDVLRIHG